MKTLLIIGKRKFEENELIKALKKENINYDIFNLRRKSYFLDVEHVQNKFGHYDVIFNLYRSHSKSVGLIETINRYLNVPTVNTAQVEKNCWDKKKTYTIFSEHKIPIPLTKVSNSLISMKEALDDIGYPAVIKDPFGSRGNNIYLIKSHENFLKQSYKILHNNTFLVQEFIEKPDRDIRCLVIDNNLIASMYRYSKNWKTNIAQGAIPKGFKPDKKLEELVINAAKALGNGVIFLDIMEDKKRGYLINEAGGMSQFKGLMTATGINVAAEIIKYGITLGNKYKENLNLNKS